MTVAGSDGNMETQLCRLMTLYERDLLRTCYAILQDRQLAEDAVQEAFLKAYRHMGGFRSESSEKTWLMRIAIKNDHHSRGVYPLTLPNQLFGVITTAYQHLQKGCAVKHPHHTLQSKSCKG